MKNNIILFVLCAGLAVFSSCSQHGDYNGDKPNGMYHIPIHDSSFLITLAYINNAEIDAAHIVAERSTDADIRMYADKKVYETQTDRTNLLAKFRCLEAPTGFNAEYTSFKASWTSLSGRQFDSAYICREDALQKQILILMDDALRLTTDDVVVNFICGYRSYIVNHQKLSECFCARYLPK